MIEKFTDFKSLSGVSSPLLPLIFSEGLYSQNEFDGAFIQKAKNGGIQAVFSLKNTCVTLSSISDESSEELESFFSFCGVTEILSDKPLTQFCEKQTGLNLFEYCGDFKEEKNCFTLNPKSVIKEYQDVYKIVFEEGNNFENWFPELSKKINSLIAFATYIKVDEKVISIAISPAVYENKAVVAGVYTLQEYRNNGYAGRCVKALINELNKNNISKIYLWCEDKNIDFYYNLNFKNIGKIYSGECK